MSASTPFISALQFAFVVGATVGLRHMTGWSLIGCLLAAVVASVPFALALAAVAGALRRG